MRADGRPGLAGPHGGAARPVLMSEAGLVASGHWTASQAGIEVLREGGNAFDAAVAAAAVVTVAEPQMSGIGGVGGAVIYDARSDACAALDFEGAMPADPGIRDPVTPERVVGLPGARVPGTVAGWTALLERYGTMKLDRLLRPAIARAREGVPVSFLLSHVLETNRARLESDTRAAATFLPNGQTPRPGALSAQPRLAATLEAIAVEGRRAFYAGGIAREIVVACVRAEGHITARDLASYEASWSPTLRAAYHGHELHTLAPPATSYQAIETLLLLRAMNVASLEPFGVEHLHRLAEIIKIAQADRLTHVGEAGFDPSILLAPAHVERRRSDIDPARASSGPGDDAHALATSDTHTTHLVAADRNGNLVSLTQTLGSQFGGSTMVGDTGMLLNNLYYKYSRPGLPLAATVGLDASGAPWMAVGTVGGFGILQTVPQLISNLVDFELNPQAAVEAPRIRVFRDRELMIEGRIANGVIEDLRGRGHECDVVGEWAYEENQLGRGHMIVRERSGLLLGGTDPRSDGYVLVA
jgi:gamma-glutamyltranspeptidase / glutathione hydrolase